MAIDKVIIIGLGQIGKRHLQAISHMNNLDMIVCGDIDNNAMSSMLPFAKKNNLNINILKYEYTIENMVKHIDSRAVVISAMTAKGRGALLAEIITHKPCAIISEKPLSQNTDEYKRVMSLSSQYNVPVYVNFTRHMYPYYKQIYSALKNSKNISLSAFFPGGIACIGIHMLELAFWLLNENKYKLIYSKKNEVYETKRKGFYDFSGELAVDINGSMCFFRSDRDFKPAIINIVDEHQHMAIYEAIGKMSVFNYDASDLKTEHITNLYTSQLTDNVIDDIHQNICPQLPDIFQSYAAHAALFELIDKHNMTGLNIT
ncbi:MAG: Gfo/Idh/MocA family oxidoreductase [bacterium]